jgi:hypothetical protein
MCGCSTPLAISDVPSYLLGHGIVDRESVIRGDLAIVDVSSRNRNFHVLRRGGPSFLLKQGVGRVGRETVLHESLVYRLLRRHSEVLRRHLPRFLDYDAENEVLLLEFVPNARSLTQHCARHPRFSNRHAADLATALAGLHRLDALHVTRGRSTPNESEDSAKRPRHDEFPMDGSDERPLSSRSPEGVPVFTGGSPWVLSLHLPGPSMLRELSGANLELIRMLQDQPEVCHELDQLRAAWQPASIIHGDLRWENCLVMASPEPWMDGIRIVDWELADLGDPCWDVGTVFAEYLGWWVRSTESVTQQDRNSEGRESNGFQSVGRILFRMQPSISTFWEDYAEQMALGSETMAWLIRAVRYAAARLIQTAYEEMQSRPQANDRSVTLLQLATNIFRDSQKARIDLLRLSETSGG